MLTTVAGNVEAVVRQAPGEIVRCVITVLDSDEEDEPEPEAKKRVKMQNWITDNRMDIETDHKGKGKEPIPKKTDDDLVVSDYDDRPGSPDVV